MHGKAMLPELKDVFIKGREEFTGATEDYKPYDVAQDQQFLTQCLRVIDTI